MMLDLYRKLIKRRVKAYSFPREFIRIIKSLGIDVDLSQKYVHPYLGYEMSEELAADIMCNIPTASLMDCVFDVDKINVEEMHDILIRRDLKVYVRGLKLPRIIPLLPVESLGWRIRELLRLMETSAIILPLHEIYDTKFQEKLVAEGAKQLLDFDGSITLSTVAPDDMLTDDNFFNSIITVYEGAGADGVIGYDCASYVDMPALLRALNVVVCLYKTYLLSREGLNVIPLVKGYSEVWWYACKLRELGYQNLSLHVSPYIKVGVKNLFFDTHFYSSLKLYDDIVCSNKNGYTILVGALSKAFEGFRRRGFFLGNVKLAGLGWFTAAQRREAFYIEEKVCEGVGSREIKQVDVASSEVYCKCKACTSESGDKLCKLAAHNFNVMQEYYGEFK